MSEKKAPEGKEDAVAEAEKTAAEKRAERLAAAQATSDESSLALEGLGSLERNDMMPFTPTDFNGMWQLAEHLSKTNVVSASLKGDVAATLSVMAQGTILNIPWPIAVSRAHAIGGAVGWPAAMMEAMVDSSPKFDFFEVYSSSREKCILEVKKKRWAEPRFYTRTIEDAEQAGFLDGKHSAKWATQPDLMLIAMARREVARELDPARFAGIYTIEELEAARAVSIAPASATSAMEAFAVQGAPRALPSPVIEASVAAPKDDRVRLDGGLVKRIKTFLAGAPAVELAALEDVLKCSLADYSGPFGTKPADLYKKVLDEVKILKAPPK